MACDTGQQAINLGCMSLLAYSISWKMAAMLCDSVAVTVDVVHTGPQTILLVMITMRNQFMGFVCFPTCIWVWGSGWKAFGAPDAPLGNK